MPPAHPPLKLSAPQTQEFWEIPVLHEDEHLLAIDKPALLPVAMDRHNRGRADLMWLLHDGITRGARWAADRRLASLTATHRIDGEASGVFLFAKNPAAFTALASQFNEGPPFLTSVALVAGVTADDMFTVDAKLAPHPDRDAGMRVNVERGKKSVTAFAVIERFTQWTLLRCQPVPGRPHQVRAHLRHVDLAIVADAVYGGPPLFMSVFKRHYRLKPGREERPLVGTLALHAESLACRHPVTGEELVINAPWPKPLRVALKYLRLHAKGDVAGSEF